MTAKRYGLFKDIKNPVCAKCQKPVDEFGEYSNPDSLARHFYAKCHGETETRKLTFYQLQNFEKGNSDIGLGEAFAAQDKLIPTVRNFLNDKKDNLKFEKIITVRDIDSGFIVKILSEDDKSYERWFCKDEINGIPVTTKTSDPGCAFVFHSQSAAENAILTFRDAWGKENKSGIVLFFDKNEKIEQVRMAGNDIKSDQSDKEIEVTGCREPNDCPFFNDGGGEFPEYCSIDKEKNRDFKYGEIDHPDWCPLKSGPITVRLKG